MQTSTLVSPKVSRSIGTSLTQVGGYTPATSAIVTGLTVANTTGSSVTCQVTIFDGTNDTNIVPSSRPIAAGDTLILGGSDFKAILVNGWSIRVRSSAVTSLDAVLFVIETS